MKRCNKCKQTKAETEFNKKSKGKLQAYCRPCDREHSKDYYKKNKEKIRRQIYSAFKRRLKERKLFRKEHLLKHPCIDCGEKNIIVLEFDHINGNKIESISKMVLGAYSLNRIKKEMNKCEVVCSNCHSIRTHNRRKQ